MLLPQSRGPRVSRHHIQENARQLPDSPGPSSPPLPGSNIAEAGVALKGPSFTWPVPTSPHFLPAYISLEGNVSVQRWKCCIVKGSEWMKTALLFVER